MNDKENQEYEKRRAEEGLEYDKRGGRSVIIIGIIIVGILILMSLK